MGIPASVTQTPPTGDQANAVVSGSFVATGTSGSFLPLGPFNVSLWGSDGPNGSWSGTVQLERSFDGGSTWIVAAIGQAATTQASWDTGKDVSTIFTEPERGVLYRLDCTAYSSGTINYRLSATGQAATTLLIPSVI